jgi:uncharacterized Tic20 family protein
MSTGGETAQPIFSIALRGGDTADVWANQVVLGGQTYPLSDLAWAGSTSDGGAPSVGLSLRDGRRVMVTPSDPPDAQRFLDVLYLHRPDLRVPPQGAPGGAWSTPPPYGYSGYGYSYQSGMFSPPQSNETVLAGLAHLSVFFGMLIVPLIIWLVTRESSPYASRQGKQAFFFHVGLTAISLVVFAIWFVFIFASFGLAAANSDSAGAIAAPFAGFVLIWGLYFVVYIGAVVLGVYGAVQAFQGKPFHYPLLGSL